MLLEGDKRGPEHAIDLVYPKAGEGRFFVPPNVYIIGLMNLADRSLAVVDYALRRRFAFVSLSPRYGSASFRKWLTDRGMHDALVSVIVDRLSQLNREISDDSLLGENYQIGHSFFCPRGSDFSRLDRDWFDGIVATELVPLLSEYWFDNPKRAAEAKDALLAK